MHIQDLALSLLANLPDQSLDDIMAELKDGSADLEAVLEALLRQRH